jgi:hypothetical protein
MVDFVISLRDAPHMRINLLAQEVSLFDMCRGITVQRQAYAAAPERWQDFVLKHRAGTEWQTSAQMRADSSCLEFQECALICGTLVTFVGELHRGADGMLSLKPLQSDSLPQDILDTPETRPSSISTSEQWRTSWECDGCDASNVASRPSTPRDHSEDSSFAKVLVSDDPSLLDGGASLMNTAASLLRKLPTKCSNHANILLNAYRSNKRLRAEKSAGGIDSHTL